jgi:hypothetical protein
LKTSSSIIREGTLSVLEKLLLMLFIHILLAFIEGELFHDQRRNLTVYERLLIDFIGKES